MRPDVGPHAVLDPDQASGLQGPRATPERPVADDCCFPHGAAWTGLCGHDTASECCLEEAREDRARFPGQTSPLARPQGPRLFACRVTMRTTSSVSARAASLAGAIVRLIHRASLKAASGGSPSHEMFPLHGERGR